MHFRRRMRPQLQNPVPKLSASGRTQPTESGLKLRTSQLNWCYLVALVTVNKIRIFQILDDDQASSNSPTAHIPVGRIRKN
jgi:hypothetical protein